MAGHGREPWSYYLVVVRTTDSHSILHLFPRRRVDHSGRIGALQSVGSPLSSRTLFLAALASLQSTPNILAFLRCTRHTSAPGPGSKKSNMSSGISIPPHTWHFSMRPSKVSKVPCCSLRSGTRSEIMDSDSGTLCRFSDRHCTFSWLSLIRWARSSSAPIRMALEMVRPSPSLSPALNQLVRVHQWFHVAQIVLSLRHNHFPKTSRIFTLHYQRFLQNFRHANTKSGTEISCGPKGGKLAWFWFSVRIQTVKTWLIDPLGLRNIQLEVSEQLPQG